IVVLIIEQLLVFSNGGDNDIQRRTRRTRREILLCGFSGFCVDRCLESSFRFGLALVLDPSWRNQPRSTQSPQRKYSRRAQRTPRSPSDQNRTPTARRSVRPP